MVARTAGTDRNEEITSLFLVTGISHDGIEILSIFQHAGWLLAIFTVHIHRSSYLWPSGEKFWQQYLIRRQDCLIRSDFGLYWSS